MRGTTGALFLGDGNAACHGVSLLAPESVAVGADAIVDLRAMPVKLVWEREENADDNAMKLLVMAF